MAAAFLAVSLMSGISVMAADNHGYKITDSSGYVQKSYGYSRHGYGYNSPGYGRGAYNYSRHGYNYHSSVYVRSNPGTGYWSSPYRYNYYYGYYRNPNIYGGYGVYSNYSNYYDRNYYNTYRYHPGSWNNFYYTNRDASAYRVTDIGANSAVAHGFVETNLGLTVFERGFVYTSAGRDPSLNDERIFDNRNMTGRYSMNIANLAANTTYYLRSYAMTQKGVFYGEIISFSTGGSIGSFQTVSGLGDIVVNLFFSTADGEIIAGQLIRATPNQWLTSLDLILPAGYSVADPNWSYTVTQDVDLSVTVR